MCNIKRKERHSEGTRLKVLSSCEIEDIEREIEEAEEVMSRIFLDIQRILVEKNNVIKPETTPKPKLSSPSLIHVEQVLPNPEPHGATGTSNTVQPQTPINPSLNLSSLEGEISQVTQPLAQQTHSRLPKLLLQKFKGDITQYRSFWDSFESAIHNNLGLSKIEKFNYLNSLLEGRALRSVQGLPITDGNYQAAVDILQQRFGKPQAIISAHMEELMKIPACNGDKPSQLRFIYDKASVHVRGLESLGVNSTQYGSLLIPVIMAKLPADVRVQIARNTTQDVWKMIRQDNDLDELQPLLDKCYEWNLAEFKPILEFICCIFLCSF